MKKILLYTTFLGLFFNVESQTFYPETKVDKLYFDSLQSIRGSIWMEGFVNDHASKITDDEIRHIYDTDKWYTEWWSIPKRNITPAYMESKDILFRRANLYNIVAIEKLKDKICPFGYRLPLKTDFENTNSLNNLNIGYRERYYELAESQDIKGAYIELYDDAISGEVVEFDGNQELFWLGETVKDSYIEKESNFEVYLHWGYIAEVNYTSDSFYPQSAEIEISAVPAQNAYPIRCIENGLKNEFSYRDILPKEYRLLINDLSNRLANNPKFPKNQEFIFSLKFDSLGKNNSNGFYLNEDRLSVNNGFKESLREKVRKFNKFPHVSDIPIKINTPLKFSQSLEEFGKRRTSLHDLIWDIDINFERKYDFKDSLQFYDHRFLKAKYIHYGYRSTISHKNLGQSEYVRDYSYSNEYSNKLIKVHANGPLSAFWSIIPGLGMNHVMKNISPAGKLYENQKKIKNTLLIGAISSGVIGLGAKLISDNYYSRYKSDRYGSNARSNYNIANASNKVFLSSSALYIALSIVDIGFTIPLGIKQKSAQKRINKRLRDFNGYILGQ